MLLRAVVLAMGTVVLALCVYVMPAIQQEWAKEYPDMSALTYAILLGILITVVAFYTALTQTLKLLSYIDKEQAFSSRSVRALRIIKRCGLAISAVYAAGLPVFYQIADSEDAPGVMVIGLIFVGASLAVSIFAAVLERLLRSAIAIKKENDLTV